MCFFCVAVPTSLTVGLTLDQKKQQKNRSKSNGMLARPFLWATLFVVLIFMAIAIFIHSQDLF